jgi:hypothetical protein
VVNQIHTIEKALHCIDVAAVGLLELDSLREILQVTADHVIAADNLVAPMDERIGEMTTEKTGDTGNENFHFCLAAGWGRTLAA